EAFAGRAPSDRATDRARRPGHGADALATGGTRCRNAGTDRLRRGAPRPGKTGAGPGRLPADRRGEDSPGAAEEAVGVAVGRHASGYFQKFVLRSTATAAGTSRTLGFRTR